MAGKKIENNTAGSPLEAHVASSKIRAEHIDKVYKTGKKERCGNRGCINRYSG